MTFKLREHMPLVRCIGVWNSVRVICFKLHAVPYNTIAALGEFSGEGDIFTLLANNWANVGEEMFLDLAGYSREKIALEETWKEAECQIEERDYWK